MTLQLQNVTIQNTDPVGLVQFAMGESGDLTRSGQWLTGQILCDASNTKSVALLQIEALRKVNELIHIETERLTRLYGEARRSQ